MGRPKIQLNVQSEEDSISNESSYEKYKKLKRKFKELFKINEQLNQEYSRTLKELTQFIPESKSINDTRELTQSTSESNTRDVQDIQNAHDIQNVQDAQNAFKIIDIIEADANSSRTLKRKATNDNDQPNIIPKRRKAPLKVPRNIKAHCIDKDENGDFILPVGIGLHTLLSHGTIVYDRPTFHNNRYIYPIGYSIRRPYFSMIDPLKNTIYTSRIEDGVDGPKFIVQAQDQPNDPIVASSATGAWTPVIKQANNIRNRKHSNAASGPDYFGLSQPTIRKMIQELPNAEKCKNYAFQVFELYSGGIMKKVFKKYDIKD
ncbi:2905_t:CDS:2 [Diversispora eburnea]|uniref:2905_t:CDS:1 n=1 Tax=Diversispora eburnea TaxID=1213867 RepID=A0A9N8ZKK8_9GLOM|nr:2905_t:CDS:2 [Diversispora eburnea]